MQAPTATRQGGTSAGFRDTPAQCGVDLRPNDTGGPCIGYLCLISRSQISSPCTSTRSRFQTARNHGCTPLPMNRRGRVILWPTAGPCWLDRKPQKLVAGGCIAHRLRPLDDLRFPAGQPAHQIGQWSAAGNKPSRLPLPCRKVVNGSSVSTSHTQNRFPVPSDTGQARVAGPRNHTNARHCCPLPRSTIAASASSRTAPISFSIFR